MMVGIEMITIDHAGDAVHRISFLGCPIDRVNIQQALEWINNAVSNGGQYQIAVINANKLYLMAQQPRLQQIIHSADLIIPEWAVVWGARQLGLPKLEHIGGIMLVHAFMPFAAEKGLRPYLLGSKQEVVQTLAEKLLIEYPRLILAGFHHGYLSKPGIEEEVISHIQQTKPDILLVGMGSPKQEYWIDAHKHQLGVSVSMGVGGSFDVLAGLKKDTPNWARGRGLEWLYRLLQDPRSYWRRYLRTNTWFMWQVMKASWMKR